MLVRGRQHHRRGGRQKAGVTAVFYNGAHWDQVWLDKIFPGTVGHPHQPDAVVDSIADLVALARHMLAQHKRVERASPEPDATRPL